MRSHKQLLKYGCNTRLSKVSTVSYIFVSGQTLYNILNISAQL